MKDQASHDDDALEFETISSVVHLALGKGLRVAQEKGTFVFYFQEPKGNKRMETYIQIDGEFYKVFNPEKIEIALSPVFGHMRVLKNISHEED